MQAVVFFQRGYAGVTSDPVQIPARPELYV